MGNLRVYGLTVTLMAALRLVVRWSNMKVYSNSILNKYNLPVAIIQLTQEAVRKFLVSSVNLIELFPVYQKKHTMNRRDFLAKSSAPVVAVCAACLGACSKNSSSTAPSNVNFNVDLASQLTTVGASLVQSGVIVVRTATGNATSSFTAVQVACTHEGTAINWNNGAGRFICPNHGANFSANGAVLVGPATRNLKQFNLSLSGNTLTVTG